MKTQEEFEAIASQEEREVQAERLTEALYHIDKAKRELSAVEKTLKLSRQHLEEFEAKLKDLNSSPKETERVWAYLVKALSITNGVSNDVFEGCTYALDASTGRRSTHESILSIARSYPAPWEAEIREILKGKQSNTIKKDEEDRDQKA